MKGYIGYPAVFELDTDGIFFVEFPDLSGCVTQGDTLEAALCNAQDVLAIYYTESQGNLPQASDLRTIQADNPGSIVQVVAINTDQCIVKPLKTIKKTLTLPKWLNDLAEKYNVNFSRILKNALIGYLKNLEDVTPLDLKMLNE